MLSHGDYRAVLDMVAQRGIVGAGSDDLIYLFLPLAHAFGLLLMLISADRGVAIAYWGRDTTKIIPELSEVHPTYLPSVPRIFEKLYTLVTSHADPELLAQATQVGLEVRELESAGLEVPSDLQAAFEEADERLFSLARGAFGGRLREAVTGAAPIAKEILEFFYAAGVPVMEGYGMTETSTTATGMRPGRPSLRFRGPRPPRGRDPDRRRWRDPARRAPTSSRATTRTTTVVWGAGRWLAAHRRRRTPR